MITPQIPLVGYLLMFTVVGILFLLGTMILGKLVRPNAPNPEKKAVYECGEPTIGSSWVQFDLRFYVVALLFVIFDVEVAFFFPWAVVFGKSAQIADSSVEQTEMNDRLKELGFANAKEDSVEKQKPQQTATTQTAARTLTRLAFGDLLVFFGVVLVGFAYLWKRGDLDWVRATDGDSKGVTAAEIDSLGSELEPALR
jgi:NADH-quinone oxidoreductase subunit A